ncbi:MAG: substrate-binding domain-containing protein [Chloroflexota bacterium]|nr:substrate-binding domain-containing protein [Chloroflexota bacterium]
MNLLQRRVGILILIALIMLPTLAFAQDATPTPEPTIVEPTAAPTATVAVPAGPVSVVGSAIPVPLFEAVVTASGFNPELALEVTGTRAGLERLCQGTADVVLATRAISDEETAACTTNAIEFVELYLGDYAIAVIAHPNDPFTCLTSDQLNTLLAPSAQGQITNWRAVVADSIDLAINLLLPDATTPEIALLDALVEGDGLRTDVTTQSDSAARIATVETTPGAVSIVTFNEALSAGTRVKTLQLAPFGGTCVASTVATINDAVYPAAQRTYAYVNRASLGKANLTPALSFFGNLAVNPIVTRFGYVAPEQEALNLNRTVITTPLTGRQHSIVRVEFSIPPTISGQINIGGDSAANDFLTETTSTFQQTYQGVVPTSTLQGRVAGVRRFCNGELDIIAVTGPLTPEQQQNCAANNVVPVPVSLGHQAAVLVSGTQNPYLQCLTRAQLATTFNAASAGTIMTWNQVDPAFPAAPITLLAPTMANDSNDLLMLGANGTSVPMRTDTIISGDPLYRAASVAVVDGALTFMPWREWLRVEASEQANIQLVAVDSGSGCVTPSSETISDGSYAIAVNVQLLVSQNALRRSEVQSFVWYLFTDERFPSLQTAGLIGLTADDLLDIREMLQEQFDAAVAAPIVPTATPGAAATPTVEATATPGS